VLAVGAMLLAAGSFLAYNALVFKAEPFWSQTYGAMAGMVSPGPGVALLLFGATAILAVPGLAVLLRGGTPARWMVLVWVVSAAVLMYVPVGVERRFALGLQPALAIAAAPAVAAIWSWIRAARYPGRTVLRPLVLASLGLTLFGSTVPVQLVMFGIALGKTEAMTPSGSVQRDAMLPFTSPWVSAFYPLELEEAATWLAHESGPDDFVLADPWTGNMMASHVDGRFFAGHAVATPYFGDKAARILEAYRSLTPEALVAFMKAERFRYVVYGPYQREAGIDRPSSASLRLVYSRNGVDIFEVVQG
jgi:hypothetical protein